MSKTSMHSRTCETGMAIGALTARMAELGARRLANDRLINLGLPGIRSEMCKSCACRAGTVPNGCLQTQLDFLKAVVEGEKFLCHAPKDGRICAGYIFARAEYAARPLPDSIKAIIAGWEYSPPDEE